MGKATKNRGSQMRTKFKEINMLQVRKNGERGRASFGWLQSSHSFSFRHYFDPNHTGFGPLLVINEDRVHPGRGFGTHGHRDMEIISYVLDGALAHQDSMGNGSVLRYGDVQRMSAGTGVQHSEFNHSSTEPVYFLQIWIEPNTKGIAPSYEEKHFDVESKKGQLRLIASSDGRDGSVLIHQDAAIYASILNGDDRVEHVLTEGRTSYVHVIRGRVTVNGIALGSGDALKIAGEKQVALSDAEAAEVLLFDLPY
jgi:redox-sensitive bicupin YhaK (pirin superfamily)